MSENADGSSEAPVDQRNGDDVENESSKRISLVLGSGGARGLAHIGIIRELNKRGFTIESISGCSMGALIGGLYAAGRMEDYAEWICGLDRSDVVGLLDVTSASGGLIAGRKVMQILRDWIGETDIADLPIPYTAVAVDIEREKEIWFGEGKLYDAIRASISIPGVFTPYAYQNRVLVDGGILNPIPVAPTLDVLTEQTFVVDANGPPTDILPWHSYLEAKGLSPEEGMLNKINTTLKKLGNKLGINNHEAELDLANVLTRSLDTMQAAITRQHLAVFHPDLVFRVPRNLYMIHEFYRAKEIIELGHQIGSRVLDDAEEGAKGWL